MPRRRLPPISQVLLEKFNGGLNLRDAASEIADNESPDCMNVTLDERGGVVKRLGRVKKNGSALPGTPQAGFYWQTKKWTIFQIGASVYKTTDDFGSWTSIATFTTTDRASFCDFKGFLVAVHPQDGVFTYDGTTWTLATAAVKGTTCAAWQNKVFVGGDKRVGNETRLWWSNIGNPAVWTTASDFNDLREVDDRGITAVGVGQGMDVLGRPGLLVFKEESAYRVNSSSTGAYTTIDTVAGAAGALAVASLFGVTCVINKRGIFATRPDGVDELVLVSEKVAPIFDPRQINFAKQDLFCAGVKGNRFVFSLPWGSAQASNNRTLEFHPIDGWIVPHDFGASFFATYAKDDQRLYAGAPAASYVYEQFKSGADDGAAIASRYQTKWLVPSEGVLNSFRHLRMFGRGVFDLYTKLDFDPGQGEHNDVSIVGDAFVWNDPDAVWNDPSTIWGPALYEDEVNFYSLGYGRSISFELAHIGTNSLTGPPLLDDGAAPEVGAFACYGMVLDYVRLGFA